MTDLREASNNLIDQCYVWCLAKGLEPLPWLAAEELGCAAVLDYVNLGKGFKDLNETQRRAVAAMTAY